MTEGGGVFVIAEAGVNHNGSLDLALQLVDAAKAAGADAVKFQTFRADRIVTKGAHKAEYQDRTTEATESHHQMLRRLELDEAAHRALLARCSERGVMFLSSPFDMESADLLDELDVPMFKIPSGEITNLPLLAHIARKGKPVLLSTGMSNLGEVERALAVLRDEGCVAVTLLHCVTEYPAPPDEINLRAMQTMRDAFRVPVGYSDHTPGSEIAIAAVALGAPVIEKHFTLDRSLPGPDHSASLDPRQFAEMVTALRHVAAALGDGVKRPAPCELKNMSVARKSLVARRALPAGTRLAAGDLDVKRPGDGVSPADLERVVGHSLRVPLDADDVLHWDDLA